MVSNRWTVLPSKLSKVEKPSRSDDTFKDFRACECYNIKKDEWKTLIIVRRLLKCCDCSHSLLWYYFSVVPGYVSMIVANYQIRTGTNKALKVAKCYLASRSFRYIPWIVQTWEVRIFQGIFPMISKVSSGLEPVM